MYIRPLQLGSAKLKNNLILAPLCGCTNLPTRLLARENGAALVFPEMAKSEAVVRHNKKTNHILYFEEQERPVAIQICGGDPLTMAETAKAVTQLGPEIIDINMGCPVKKIVNTEAGSALLKDPIKAEAVISAVVKATNLPVTVKMRAGWDEGSLKHKELGRAVENAGAVAVTLHPRTRNQFFQGKSDWSLIAEVKELVSIPVIGNGDIKTPQDAERMFAETNCDGIMIGRAAMGNPWIFRDILNYFETGSLPVPVKLPVILDAMRRHFEMMLKVEGELNGMLMMRRHAPWYIKGRAGAAKTRKAFSAMCEPADFYHILEGIENNSLAEL